MIFTTKGIVLQSIKYGETSLIVAIFTELFGIQSYLVNGVRTSGKAGKAHFFQPSSILEMQVYHNELKNLQRIKEIRWSILYKTIFSQVTKNAVALYMVELLYKCLKQPETNERLFSFCEDAFTALDDAGPDITANFPIYFALQLAPFLGFRVSDNYSPAQNIFDYREGRFTGMDAAPAGHPDPEASYILSQLLKAIHPQHLGEISTSRSTRKNILVNLENFYAWHLSEFGSMKTLPVLFEILS